MLGRARAQANTTAVVTFLRFMFLGPEFAPLPVGTVRCSRRGFWPLAGGVWLCERGHRWYVDLPGAG